MDGFKNIEIKNFRGIRNLIIDAFSMLNVFLGQNGVGKSPVLVGHILMMGISDFCLPQTVNVIRLRCNNVFADLAPMLHSYNLRTNPEISSMTFDKTSTYSWERPVLLVKNVF